MNIKKDILWRVYVAFLSLAIFAGTVVVYAFNIQVVEKDKWRAMAQQSTRDVIIEAARGNIYASDGRLLATSIPYYEVRMDLAVPHLKTIPEVERSQAIDSLAKCMANEFKDKSARDYADMLNREFKNRNRYLLIKRNATYEQVKRLKDWPIFEWGKYKGGLIVMEEEKRKLPFDLLALRTIGFSRENYAVGLEGAYDSLLRGVSGRRLMQKVAGGWAPVNDANEIEPENGKDIITTIDVSIQDVAEDALYKALEKNDADYGCAIVMEVKTGRIKAIANLKKGKNGGYQEAYNYAIGTASEPGSTFKLASAIALLEDKHVNLGDSIDIEHGETKFYDQVMRDSRRSEYRNISFRQAFEKSSNVAFSKVVFKYYKDNPQKFIAQLEKMGLTKPLGLDIKGEPTPTIKRPGQEGWSGTTLPWMSIGYEVLQTPLQTLALYNAVANNGVLMRPMLVDEIRETGKLVKKFKPQVLQKSICSEETLKKVRELMEGVVERGTARNLKGLDYKVAGKTGTAQVVENGRYTNLHKASFAGYFPADNPEYSCIVFVHAPRKGIYYGNLVAGPVFKEIADKLYSTNLDLQPDVDQYADLEDLSIPLPKNGYKKELQEVLNRLAISNHTEKKAEQTDWVYADLDKRSVDLGEREIITGLVPNVVNMGLRDALYLLENAGMVVLIEGTGKVRKQSIPPGVKIRKGTRIRIELR